ncbi:EAL domain-containing protein [Acidovorax sp. LjRoot74]|uniref:putative bifunctional diguanylate cyclase/phosphodiesterase n=1 Tax=Acidovorax sp. LjRoot74 TaxID=3342337 RepID=UPI003ECEF497
MINRLLNRLSPFRSVRARFSVVLAASGLVLGLLLTLFMEWHLEESLRTAATQAVQVLADEIAYELADDLGNRRREIALVADVYGLGGSAASAAALRKMVDSLQARNAAYAWIGLANMQGTVTAATGGLLMGQNVAARPWFSAGLRGDFLSDPHEAVLLAKHLQETGADGEPLRFLDVAVPLRNAQGSLHGVLAAHLHMDWVREVVSSVALKTGRHSPVEVQIFGADGTWLLGVNEERGEQRLRLEQPQTLGEGGRYLVAFQRVKVAEVGDLPGWTVVVRESTATAFAPVDRVRGVVLLSLVVMIALFAWVSWLLAGRFTRPIVQLADVAKTHAGESSSVAGRPSMRARDETSVLGEVMEQLAHHDRLTGLFNRSEVLARLHARLDLPGRSTGVGALLLINLDNFSVLNNMRGHDVGDQLLVTVATRLQALGLEHAVLARPGGDEFLVLMESLGADHTVAMREASSCADAVLAACGMPLTLAGATYQCQLSIGIAPVGDGVVRVEEVLQHAELAMLEAKKRGKNQAVLFDQRMQDAFTQRVAFEQALRAAVPGQLVAHYQPQFNMDAGLFGAELLVRWQHPTMGMVSPDRFIPVAEDIGVIVDIGRWVLETACLQLKAWEREPALSHLVIAVNVSAKDFRQEGYVDVVRQVLERTGARAQQIKIELTESVLAVDVDDVVAKMLRLKALGLSFSLDDFGTGFSSLSYLQRMPLDQLKIDKSFVRDVTTNTNDASIVRAVIALGQGLGISVIAEGVETPAQRDFLSSHGCEHFQGYLYGRPLPVEDFAALAQEC